VEILANQTNFQAIRQAERCGLARFGELCNPMKNEHLAIIGTKLMVAKRPKEQSF
jgi:hypothetical protein